jgi:RNA polymerase sigma-54 factor
MHQGMELRLRQHLGLTPQVQQALRLLQLSSLEFRQEVEQALVSNPLLEDERDQDGAAAASAPAGSPASSMAELPPTPDSAPDAHADAIAPRSVGEEGPRHGATSDNDDADWTDWSESTLTLRDHLRGQLLLSQMGERDRALAHLVIDSLNEDGYLETPLEELATLLEPEDDVQIEELTAALRLVQNLEPAGIAARSLQECLLLQLQALPEQTPGRAVATVVVRDYLPLLADHDFARLQQLARCDEQGVHIARALIRSLDPRPGRRFGPDDTEYVVPEVIVTKQRARWVATINPAVQPRLRLNPAYAEIATRRNGASPAFARQLQEARWFIRNVEQRFRTTQRVATAIIARQHAFFDYGEAAMKPLELKHIAAEVGLHESTISRVTHGKYMATPRGVFEFKHFFSRKLATHNGGVCSATAIRALLKELIAGENPRDPLSDAQLAGLLASQGLRVARRTITKYRTAMRLPNVELRRVARTASVG